MGVLVGASEGRGAPTTQQEDLFRFLPGRSDCCSDASNRFFLTRAIPSLSRRWANSKKGSGASDAHGAWLASWRDERCEGDVCDAGAGRGHKQRGGGKERRVAQVGICDMRAIFCVCSLCCLMLPCSEKQVVMIRAAYLPSPSRTLRNKRCSAELVCECEMSYVSHIYLLYVYIHIHTYYMLRRCSLGVSTLLLTSTLH
jgi:hypothetical protein